MTFDKVLDKYRRMSFFERDKGSRFERLMQTYLQTAPEYSGRFKKVLFFDINLGKQYEQRNNI
jgi:predicted helicase